MVTAAFAVTTLVATLKVALVTPAGTVTEAGTVAAAVLLLASATTAPPDGAAAFNVTVPVLVPPPTSEDGFPGPADCPAIPGIPKS